MRVVAYDRSRYLEVLFDDYTERDVHGPLAFALHRLWILAPSTCETIATPAELAALLWKMRGDLRCYYYYQPATIN